MLCIISYVTTIVMEDKQALENILSSIIKELVLVIASGDTGCSSSTDSARVNSVL